VTYLNLRLAGNCDAFSLEDYHLCTATQSLKLAMWDCGWCSVKDFHAFADVLETVKEKGVIVAVASADDIAAANEERPGLLQVKNVL